MKPHGVYPNVIYRSFDKLEYLNQFVSGSVRFGALRYYRYIEDKGRRDETEGIGQFIHNGIKGEVEFPRNEIYAVCCYKDIDSALRSNHGKFIVEIGDPLYLAEELTRSLQTLPKKFFGPIEGVPISYSKGELATEKPSSYEISRLTYNQKPQCFSHENEFRYIFILEEFAGDHLCLHTKNGIGAYKFLDLNRSSY